jgi:3-oxoacyl-(acyl-carrier-protein) synthase III
MARPTSGFGIIGMGMDVPSTVRTNDWWPESFVRRFESRAQADITTPEVRLDGAASPAQRIQIEEMLKTHGDPFRGSKERRIASPEDRVTDYEVRAARKAMDDAGVSGADIDFVIVSSLPSDEWTPGDGFALHHQLAIGRGPVLTIDPGCAAFVTALALADSALRVGQATMVLIVVSAFLSRITDWEDPSSVAFGDAAAAVVVGPVRSTAGFVAHASGADGSKYAGVTIGPKSGTPWYQGAGKILLHSRDVDLGRSVVMQTTHYAELAVSSVLGRAGMERQDITHVYCHQASSWFNRACRRALGLKHCQTVDTFERYASVGAANVAVNLASAREQGQLSRGHENVLLFSFGIGIAWASCIVRWAC